MRCKVSGQAWFVAKRIETEFDGSALLLYLFIAMHGAVNAGCGLLPNLSLPCLIHSCAALFVLVPLCFFAVLGGLNVSRVFFRRQILPAYPFA